MKKIFIIMILLLNFTCLMAGITVKGKAMIVLTSEDFEYENIKIYFRDVNTGNIVDSTLTDKNGFYTKNIGRDGIYDIIFVKNNLYGIFKNIECYSSLFIKEIQLDNMILRDSKLFEDIDLFKNKIIYAKDNDLYIGLGICISEYIGYTLEIKKMNFPIGIKLFTERTKGKIKYNESYVIEKENKEDLFGLIFLFGKFYYKKSFYLLPGIGFDLQSLEILNKDTEEYEHKCESDFIIGIDCIIPGKYGALTIGFFNKLNINICLLIKF